MRWSGLLSFTIVVTLWMVVMGPPNSMLVAAQTTCNLTNPYLDNFVCSGNDTTATATPLSGNNAALETLRGWCAADSRCAELYGQQGVAKLALFAHLFQTTYPGSISDAYLETPILTLLCNQTSEEFMITAWQLMLKEQILDSSQVCDVNERATLDSSTGTVVCSCQAGKVCDNSSGSQEVQIMVTVAVLLAVVIQFGVVIWDRRQTERKTEELRNAIRRAIANAQAGQTPTPATGTGQTPAPATTAPTETTSGNPVDAGGVRRRR